MIDFIERLGRSWAQTEGSPRLLIGDISKEGGGRLPPHKSHDKGLDVDVQIIRKDRAELVRSATVRDPAYSRDLTQKLVNQIRTTAGSDLKYIFSADTQLSGVTEEVNHVYHLHVRLLP